MKEMWEFYGDVIFHPRFLDILRNPLILCTSCIMNEEESTWKNLLP